MSNHEYFRKMSALSAIGQLSAKEDQELAEHLNECVSCRDIYFDYARVVRQQLPQADPIRWRIKSALPVSRGDPEVRARFLARARADGIDFSVDAERANGAKSNPSRRPSRLWSALAIAPVLVLAILVLWVGRRYELIPRFARTGIDPRSAQLAHENDDLRAQLAALRKMIEQDAATIAEMKKGSAESLESQQKLQKRLDESWQQAAKLSDDLHRTEAEKDEMARASQGEGATIGSLRGQYESLSHERTEMLNSHAILEAQVRNLTAALEEKNAALERERQLTAVSKDVRQLMGARNLHIMDVHDMGGSGENVRAFGTRLLCRGAIVDFLRI